MRVFRRALIRKVQAWLQKRAVEYYQIKNSGLFHPDEKDARTSDFCLVMGLKLLDGLSQIWIDDNPCLILIKKP